MVAESAAPVTPYTIAHRTATTISDDQFTQCFELLKYTSAAAYRASSIGWSKQSKVEEMRDANMQFLLVFGSTTTAITTNTDAAKSSADNAESVEGFLSYMLTEEDEMDVVYCYEIHLSDRFRGHGIGKELMQKMHQSGRDAGMEMAMLTVFTSNVAAMEFYRHLGYEYYDEEQPPSGTFKRLRSGPKPFKPTYVIMAKDMGAAKISGTR